MKDRLSLHERLLLEINRASLKLRTLDHELHQLFWECTLRCNLSCLHCGSDCRVSSSIQDPPLSDLTMVLDEIAQRYDPSKILVITTGGEPLMRDDIVECGRAITERGFKWGMVSNGLCLDERKMTSLHEAGLKTIAISLDGFEEHHNWMRGNNNSYQRAVNAIRILSQTRDITWDVITCANKRNLSQLSDFGKYLLDLGVSRWRIFTIFPYGRAMAEADLHLSGDELLQLMDFIKKTREDDVMRVEYSCEGFLGPMEGKVRNRLYSCSAGINIASVLADGSISGCLSIRHNYHQGNIHRDSFCDVWENKFKNYRDRSWMKKDECAACKMWRYCQGNGMHLRDENGDLALCHYNKMFRPGV